MLPKSRIFAREKGNSPVWPHFSQLWLKTIFQIANQPIEVALRNMQRRTLPFERQIISAAKDDLNETVFRDFPAPDLHGVGHAINFNHFQLAAQIINLLDNSGGLLPEIAFQR